MKKILIIVIILAVAGFAWHKWGQGNKKDEAPKKPPVAISVAPVQAKDIPIEIKNVGTVVPTQSVAVRSRLDSQIMEIRFKDGDFVKQGDVLFVLDDRTIKAQLEQQSANLTAAKAQLDNLKQQFSRNEELVKQGYESQANLDESKAAYLAQLAAVKASDASVENLKVQLEYTRITAPISGRTGNINFTIGNTVKANDTTALVTINEVQPIRVQISLAQQYITQVRQAMAAAPVSVLIPQENGVEALNGKLEYIDNNINQQTGTFIAKAIFANEHETLWPGMFVNLVIDLGTEKQAVTIPEVALQHGQDNDFVFVIENNTAKKRIVVSERSQGDLAVISKGLQPNEMVATDGIMSLSDGSSISVNTGDGKDNNSDAVTGKSEDKTK